MQKNKEERLEKYLKLTGKALRKVRIKEGLNTTDRERAIKLKDMAERYYRDALFFKEKNKRETSLSAVVYAHAWLDIGAFLGFFDVADNKLFMVD